MQFVLHAEQLVRGNDGCTHYTRKLRVYGQQMSSCPSGQGRNRMKVSIGFHMTTRQNMAIYPHLSLQTEPDMFQSVRNILKVI